MNKNNQYSRKRTQSAFNQKSNTISSSVNKKDQRNQNFIIKKAFDLQNPLNMKHVIQKIKKEGNDKKEQPLQQGNVLPMTFNLMNEFDNEALEMELKSSLKILEQEKKQNKELKSELDQIELSIKNYEQQIQERKFLFQNQIKSKQNSDFIQSDEQYLDKHTQSLLQMMQNKQQKLEKKLNKRQKQFKNLQKGQEYTELQELIQEIKYLNREINRIENLPQDYLKAQQENIQLNKEITIQKQKKIKIKNNNNKKIKISQEQKIQDNYFDLIKSKFKTKNKKIKDDTVFHKEEQQIFVINHLILENLRDDNKKLSKELNFLNQENLELHQTNSSIQETIKLQKNTLEKLNSEFEQKKNCYNKLQDQKEISKFKKQEKNLQNELKQQQQEILLLENQVKERNEAIQQKKLTLEQQEKNLEREKGNDQSKTNLKSKKKLSQQQIKTKVLQKDKQYTIDIKRYEIRKSLIQKF